jgi:hypothetical protein
MKKKTRRNWWEDPTNGNPPAEYDECYLRALRRMAVTLNCGSPGLSPFKPIVLAKSDPDLAELLTQRSVESTSAFTALVNHEIVTHNEKLEDFDQAENLFYGDFDFSCPRGFKNVTRVTHRSTPAFRNWSFKRLIWPTIESIDGAAERLKKRSGETDTEFMMSCASNYLLKNFWHNFVHRRIQGITSQNYHDFGGEARDQSDFTADNIGTVIFVKSYGFTLPTGGRSTAARTSGVTDLLRRNRCNLVFAERDRLRIERTAALATHERWEEAQWQFRRRVAAAISNGLIERGAVVTSLAVYLRRERRTREGWFFHDRNVVVQLNGQYLTCNHVPYIPDPAKELKSQTRAKAYNRRGEIAESAIGQYISLLNQDAEVRAHAKACLNAMAIRVNAPLV